MNDDSKVLSGLSYLSIIVFPVIFPFIVWLVSDNQTRTHYHAGRALKLHILPTVISILYFGFIGGVGMLTGSHTMTGFTAIPLMVIVLIIDFALGLYSLYYGIKLLAKGE